MNNDVDANGSERSTPFVRGWCPQSQTDVIGIQSGESAKCIACGSELEQSRDTDSEQSGGESA